MARNPARKTINFFLHIDFTLWYKYINNTTKGNKMTKKILIGVVKGYERENSKNKCYVTLKLDNGKFSACGEIWKQNMSDIVSGGQNLDTLLELFPDNPTMKEVYRLWKRWHLNDMRSGCEHQRDWGHNEIEIVSYGLTYEAHTLRNKAIERSAQCSAKGIDPELSAMERSLILLENWFSDFTEKNLPKDPALYGCFQEKKREKKLSTWVYEKEHSLGVLCKPCPVCGYKFGTSWNMERIEANDLEAIKSLMMKEA